MAVASKEKLALREVVAEIERLEDERARLDERLTERRQEAARLLRMDQFMAAIRPRRTDLGGTRRGSQADKAVAYLKANPGKHSLGEIMQVVGSKNRKSFAVTMVKLKQAGLVQGGERGGGFTATGVRA